MAEEAPTTEQTSLSEKASSLFGSGFKGEVSELPDEEEQEDAEQEEPEEVEAQETEETEQPESEIQDSVEYDLSDIAQLMGVEEDRLDVNDEGRIVLVSKVDGETTPVSAKDLLDNAQMYTAADKRLEDAKAKAQAQTQELQQLQQAKQQEIAKAAKIVERAEKLLDNDNQSIDWKALREDDPAEYSAKRAEFSERRQEIERMKQEAVEEYEKAISGSQMTPEQIQQAQQEQKAELQKRIPDWQDKSVFQKEAAVLPKYIQEQGFSSEDVEFVVGSQRAIGDARMVDVFRKAMLYDQGKEKTQAAKKKVAKVPKVAKPGAANQQQQPAKKKVLDAKSKLKKSGRLEDAFNVLRAGRGG